MKCTVWAVNSDLRDSTLVFGIHNTETPLCFEHHSHTAFIQNTTLKELQHSALVPGLVSSFIINSA